MKTQYLCFPLNIKPTTTTTNTTTSPSSSSSSAINGRVPPTSSLLDRFREAVFRLIMVTALTKASNNSSSKSTSSRSSTSHNDYGNSNNNHGHESMNLGAEMSALAANRQSYSLGPLKNFQKKDYKKMKMEDYKRMKMEKELKKCSHCGLKGHVKEECFEINGYPEWFKQPRAKAWQKEAANMSRQEEEAAGNTPLDHSSQREGCFGESAEQESLHTDAVEEENTARDSEGISDDNVHQLVEERRPQRGSQLPKRYQDFILDMPKSRSKL
ncbi:hypothetical protein BVRB_6g130710 [Beta vulgaris subsp. vulgaris]|nr:hypothetical protein BVRB_6g130710 [Beta vulgaris subsp. vulgaris]